VTKLLILSDSHNSASAVERILHAESDANAVVFLGDGLRDLEDALTLHPKMKVYAVAGNCDFGALEPLDGLAAFDQVVVFYTHGHMYGVKYDLDTLADAAAARGAEVALFGHTHKPIALQKNGVGLGVGGSRLEAGQQVSKLLLDGVQVGACIGHFRKFHSVAPLRTVLSVL